MDYDPIKDRLGAIIGRSTTRQRLFFTLLHVLLLRAWHVRRVVRSLLRARTGAARVLDAGTGFGQYAWFVARRFPEVRVVAVDIKADYLERAAALFSGRAPHITVHYDDLTALKTPGPFDLVLAIDVMEHIEADEIVLSHLARVMARGGSLVISTPSDQGGSDAEGAGAGAFVGEHVRDGYNKEDLEAKVKRAGLAVKESRYTYGPYGAAAWRLLMKTPLSLLSASWGFMVLMPFYYAVMLPLGCALHMLDVHRTSRVGRGLLVVAQKL